MTGRAQLAPNAGDRPDAGTGACCGGAGELGKTTDSHDTVCC